MKKIIPFNNVIDFNTDIKEISAISLEHEIKKYQDMITGVFYISGEYKISEGLLEKETFNFELPFDIALTNNYNLDSLLVDIDDFRYDIISDKSLKVNIDLYIDGEEIELPQEREIHKEDINKDLDEELELLSDLKEEITESEEVIEEQTYEEELKETKCEDNIEKHVKYIEDSYNKQQEQTKLDNKDILNEEIKKINNIDPTRIDLLKDMLNDKENNMPEEININNNENNNSQINIFNKEDEDKYVTYRVYKVLENDTIDTILTKYNITKEQLYDYNNIENITTGDKLIIPTNE